MHQNFRPPAPTRRAPRRIAKRRIDKAARRKHGRPLHLCGPEPLERNVKVELSFQVLFPSVQYFDDLLLDHSRAAASRPPSDAERLAFLPACAWGAAPALEHGPIPQPR